MALFAANFIRWATLWLAEQVQPLENALNLQKMGIKRQVQVGAHVSAQVIRSSEGMLLKFSEHSAFVGKVLAIPKVPLPSRKQPDRQKDFLMFYAVFYRIASDCTTVTLDFVIDFLEKTIYA